MTWAAWRLQRTETIVAAAIVAALAAVLVPSSIHIASAFSSDHLSRCVGVQSFTCAVAIGGFIQQFATTEALLPWLNLVPGIVGVLLAAPLLLELESGTYRFAWTQSVTRRRWLAGKLGVAIAVALLAMLVLSLLASWFRGPLDRLSGHFDGNAFDFEGTVDYAYVLFALGLALAIGVVARRAVPALVVGFIAYVVARVFTDQWLRRHFLTPHTATWKASAPGPDLSHAWVLMQGPSDRFGHLPPALRIAAAAPRACVGHTVRACVGFARGPASGYMHAVYFPANSFWPLQAIETAVFAAVALALILFAAWWLKERVA